MFDIHRVELDWGGRKLTLETGKVARQADGAVIATYGETTVSPPSVAAKQPKPGIDFLPLTVNYTEKYYAAGRIPGGYFKRERGPTEKDTLTSRLIDRPIRPLFADGWRCDTQVIITVLSHDQENDPDIVAMVAASAALTLSGAPFMGPIGGARVAFINNEYVLNPTIDEMKESQLDLVVAGTPDAVLMVESEAKELSEEIMLGAVMFGHRHMQPVIQAIIQLAEKAAKEPRDFAQPDTKAIEKEMLGVVEADLRKAYAIPAKHERQDAVAAVKKKAMAHFFPDGKDNPERPMTAGRRRVQGARSQDRALEHPRHQQAHRRPRSRHRAPDRRARRRSCRAPTARRCSPAARPRRSSSPRSAPARTSSGSTRCRAPTKKRSCCTTTSRRSRSARPAAWARPAAARSATASSPGARSARCCRPKDEFPYTIRVVSEITEFERLVVDGDRVRHLARADGCRRAAEAADRRHRHGPDPRGQALRRAVRHPRRRGSSRRHGLQGGRHRGGHHRPADGHQDRRHHRRDHEGGAASGQGRPPAHPRRDGEGARPRRAPSSANTRRASRPSRSRPTRSAK